MFSGSVTFLRQGVCYFLSIFLLPNHVVTVMKQESELKLIMVLTNGHLDHIFDVLDAHRHPCIMLGRFALLWMGVAVLQEHVSVDTVQYHFQKLTQESVSRARRP
jgi:hypothetical protein